MTLPENTAGGGWHTKTAAEVLKELGSSAAGLGAGEAALRLEKYGPNVLKEKKKRGALAMFLGQFRDFMIAVLIAAAVISVAIGESLDAAVIAAIVLLNSLMGFVQEYRAQKALEALKKMAAPSAAVLRGGKPPQSRRARWCPGISWCWRPGAWSPPTCG